MEIQSVVGGIRGTLGVVESLGTIFRVFGLEYAVFIVGDNLQIVITCKGE